MSKKISELFVRTANVIDNSVTISYCISPSYCHMAGCSALSTVANNSKIHAFMRVGFSGAFQPKGVSRHEWWFGAPFSKKEKVNRRRADHRIYAMLLMAELAKDQGL